MTKSLHGQINRDSIALIFTSGCYGKNRYGQGRNENSFLAYKR